MPKERYSRIIIILLLALPMMFALLMKQRVTVLRETAGLSTTDDRGDWIGISVNNVFYGLYSLSANIVTDIAKVMAHNVRAINTNKHLLSEYIVKATPGSRLNISFDHSGNVQVEADRLPANALYLLGLSFDINSLSAEDLELLPSIGPVLAKSIIEYRQNNGGKMRADELINVNGIGEKKFKALRRFFL